MNFCRFLCGAFLTFVVSLTSATEIERSSIYHFTQDWCPSQDDLDRLSAHFYISMSRTCCISRAEQKVKEDAAGVVLIQSLSAHLTSADDADVCSDSTKEERLSRAAAEAADRQAALVRETERAKEAEDERKALPFKLRRMELDDICLAIGRLLRDSVALDDVPTLSIKAVPIITAELKRRHEQINLKRAKDGIIQIGDSHCQVAASWGNPASINLTQTRYGSSSQYVFSTRQYVYFENGKVSAIQN